MRREGDLKSKKFKGIGLGNWFEVLSTSPAEPGLASLQPIPTNTSREKVLAEMRKAPHQRWQGLEYKRNMLSAGGWSDLHPTGVLKASGCERIAYLTRKDGETVFGQQLFIRLTGQQEKVPFWAQLREKNNEGWPVTGAAADSPWNKLYNLGNPNSSFNRALALADATYCTNWNSFDVFQGQMWPMVAEAYAAPVFLRTGTPQDFRVNASSADISKFPGCAPKTRANSGSNPPPVSVDPAL